MIFQGGNMYIITVSYKRQKHEKNKPIPSTEYFKKITKAVGRDIDSLWSHGRAVVLRWERKSTKSADRILKILSKFRNVLVSCTEDGR